VGWKGELVGERTNLDRGNRRGSEKVRRGRKSKRWGYVSPRVFNHTSVDLQPRWCLALKKRSERSSRQRRTSLNELLRGGERIEDDQLATAHSPDREGD
jgi:hypothetical protein